MRLKTLLIYLLFLNWLPIAIAMDSQSIIDSAERIQFAKGQFSATITGQMSNQADKNHYILRASSGQTMSVQLNSNTPYAYASVFLVAGNQLQEVLSTSATPTRWSNILPHNADYIIRVGLTQPDTAQIHYRLEISVYEDQAQSLPPVTAPTIPPVTAPTIPPVIAPTVKTVEQTVKEASEQVIPITPKPIEEVMDKPENNIEMLVTTAEIEGDYILNRKANLNVLKIFGNRVFIRITGLGQTTCNFTGSGLLTSDMVTIHNKFIDETIQFEFLPDTVVVRGGNKASAFCAGDMSVVGKYVRPHLLPPIQVAEPTKPKPASSTNVIEMLKCRCVTFNREPVATQQSMQTWMQGFRQGKQASTRLSLDLSATNIEASLAKLTQFCATNKNSYLLQVHEDLIEQQTQQSTTEVEEEGTFAFMRKLVKRVGNIIESISSQELDMSRHLCFDFRRQSEENQRIIMSWVLGYGQGRIHNFSEISVDFSTNFLDKNIQVLANYCANHENEILISAADALSSRNK